MPTKTQEPTKTQNKQPQTFWLYFGLAFAGFAIVEFIISFLYSGLSQAVEQTGYISGALAMVVGVLFLFIYNRQCKGKKG